jgi:hypothetical protein
METDKIHERVLELQKNVEKSSPQEQVNMLGELFDMVSQIEQTLSEVKLDINKIKNEE